MKKRAPIIQAGQEFRAEGVRSVTVGLDWMQLAHGGIPVTGGRTGCGFGAGDKRAPLWQSAEYCWIIDDPRYII